MASRGALPVGCTTRCRRSAAAEPWSFRGMAQGRGGFGCPPLQRPLVAPLGRELARPTERLPQRLAGDT